MNNTFEENIKIRYSEMDYNLMLKPAALLQFLQDLASDHAEKLGFGYSYIVKNNLAWFLLKYHMEFENYPINLYNLNLKTVARGYNKLFAMRDFELYNGNMLLGRVSSVWALVDRDSKKLEPVSQALNNNPNMPQFEKHEDDLVFEKIKPLNKIDSEKVFEIKFDDIDVNEHANNANYIVWAFETLGFEFRKCKKLKSLDINFKKEIKFGNKVLSQVEIDGDVTNHVVKCAETGDDLCVICAHWIDK